jgi:hypothetical protein
MKKIEKIERLVDREKKSLDRTNKILNRAAKTVPQVPKEKVKRKKKQERAKVVNPQAAQSQSMRAARDRGGLVGSPYHQYLSTLARPFDVSDVFCPVSYNPAPSFIQTRARTTRTELSLGVAVNTTTQLTIFPGHVPIVEGSTAATVAAAGTVSALDPSSFHQSKLLVNATNYSVGPMSTTLSTGTYAPVIGTKTTAIGPGLSYYSSAAVATASGLTYDVALPYTANEALGHSRWQLVSMGIRVQNITNDLYRGGTVVTVQPNIEYQWADNDAQSTFEKFPTFHDWGRCAGVELSWIPRTQDMAFWHTVETPTSGSHRQNLRGPAILVWLNAPADYAQTYSYEIVCNWQLAGSYLNTVGGPAEHYPSLKAPIEQTASALINSSPTAHPAVQLGVAALKSTGLTTDSLSSKMGSLVGGAAKAAVAGFLG